MGPWGPWGPFGQGSLRSPKQITVREKMFFLIFENNFLLFCRANHPIIVKVWLNFWALVGYPLCAMLHLLMHFLIRNHMLFLMAIFQKLERSSNSIEFPQMFMFPQLSAYFLQFSLISFMFLFKIKNISVLGKLQ